MKFNIHSEEGQEDRIEISLKGIGEVILVETFPEYEFLEDIGEDGLEELGLEEGDLIGKIEHLEIEDKYKGQGYAKLLMKKAIEVAKEKDLMPLYLNASPMGSKQYGLNIEDLTGFYESLGFEVFLQQGGNNLMILQDTYKTGGETKNKIMNKQIKIQFPDTYAKGGMTIDEIDEEKNKLIQEVDVLIPIHKKKYGKMDIESPKSIEEKESEQKIAKIFSRINELISMKRKITKGYAKGGVTYSEWSKDDFWQEQFQEWMEDGNVTKNADGSYSTQDAQYRNSLRNMYELKKYFYNEFIKGQYDSYAGGGSIADLPKMIKVDLDDNNEIWDFKMNKINSLEEFAGISSERDTSWLNKNLVHIPKFNKNGSYTLETDDNDYIIDPKINSKNQITGFEIYIIRRKSEELEYAYVLSKNLDYAIKTLKDMEQEYFDKYAGGGKTTQKYVVIGGVYDGGEVVKETFDNLDEAISLATEIENGWTDDGTYYLVTIYNETGKKVAEISTDKYFHRLTDNKLFKKIDFDADTKKERQAENEKLKGYKFNLQVRIASYPDNLTIYDKTFDSIFDVMDKMNYYYEENYYSTINRKGLDYWEDKMYEIDQERNFIKGKYGWSFIKEGNLWIAKDDYEDNHIVRIVNGKLESNDSAVTKGALKQIAELEAQKKYSEKPKHNKSLSDMKKIWDKLSKNYKEREDIAFLIGYYGGLLKDIVPYKWDDITKGTQIRIMNAYFGQTEEQKQKIINEYRKKHEGLVKNSKSLRNLYGTNKRGLKLFGVKIFEQGGLLDDINLVAKAIEYITGSAIEIDSIQFEGNSIYFRYKGQKRMTDISKKLIQDTISMHRKSLEMRGRYAGGGELSEFKMKLNELDSDGNTSVEYDEENEEWYWEDYSNDSYRGGFESELEAYQDLIDYLSDDDEYASGGGVDEDIYYGVVDANNILVFQSQNKREAEQVSWSYGGSIVVKYKGKAKIHKYADGGEVKVNGLTKQDYIDAFNNRIEKLIQKLKEEGRYDENDFDYLHEIDKEGGFTDIEEVGFWLLPTKTNNYLVDYLVISDYVNDWNDTLKVLSNFYFGKPMQIKFVVETSGDLDLALEDELQKIKLLSQKIDFNKVVGVIDYEKSDDNTDLDFYKGVELIMSVNGDWNEETEELDTLISLVDGENAELNYHPFDGMGGVNFEQLKKNINEAFKEMNTYSAVVSIEGYEEYAEDVEGLENAKNVIQNIKGNTRFQVLKGSSVGVGKRVDDSRVVAEYEEGGETSGLITDEQVKDLSFKIKIQNVPLKKGVLLHEIITLEKFDLGDEKNISFYPFHLIYGDSSLAIFDAFGVDEVAGLKRADAEKKINELKAQGKTEKDGSFIAGLTNYVGDKLFMFFNVQRLSYEGFANRVLPHEALHLSRNLISLLKNDWVRENLNTPNWWEDKRASFESMDDSNEEFFAETLERTTAIAMDGWFRVTGQKCSVDENKTYKKGGEAGFDDTGTSMAMYHEKQGNWLVPKGQVYLWLYDVENSAEKIESEEFDFVQYPLTSMSMAFQRGYIPPLKRIWTKKFQKEHKGSEHLLGVIKAYLIEKEGKKELYIDMMSVNPKKKKKGIMSYMIKDLRDTFGLSQDQITFSQLTKEGEKFVAKKTYADGGSVESEINKLYAKSNFINDDFNWQGKLLEMLQDMSIEAYEIYQSLTEEQKEKVLQELYEMDNDMGSYGDGDIETSRENLQILLEDAKNDNKYADGGGVEDLKNRIKMDLEIMSLLYPNERQFLLQSDTKVIENNRGMIIITDGKREIVFSKYKTKLKKLGNATSSSKELFNKKYDNGGN